MDREKKRAESVHADHKLYDEHRQHDAIDKVEQRPVLRHGGRASLEAKRDGV